MSAHHCHAEGCSRVVKPRMFACIAHWRMVPSWLQRCLWFTYREGQEDRKDPTLIYLIVQTRCRYAIARAEGRDTVALVEQLRQLIGKHNPAFVGPMDALDDATLLPWIDANIVRLCR